MPNQAKERKVNTQTPAKNDGVKRLPHERDESPDAQNNAPHESMKQAASDLEQGLIDTDLHGTPGIRSDAAPQSAQPNPAAPGKSRRQ